MQNYHTKSYILLSISVESPTLDSVGAHLTSQLGATTRHNVALAIVAAEEHGPLREAVLVSRPSGQVADHLRYSPSQSSIFIITLRQTNDGFGMRLTLWLTDPNGS